MPSASGRASNKSAPYLIYDAVEDHYTQPEQGQEQEQEQELKVNETQSLS